MDTKPRATVVKGRLDRDEWKVLGYEGPEATLLGVYDTREEARRVAREWCESRSRNTPPAEA